jgi:lipoprotein Spr
VTSCGTQKQSVSTSNSNPIKKEVSPAENKSSKASSSTNSSSSLKEYQKKYDLLLGNKSCEIDNLELFRFIDEWLLVPYKYAGKSKFGVDCSGLASLLMKQVYGKTISGSSANIYEQTNPVSRANLKEGDLVFFKINSPHISHMGVYLENNKFIHASTHGGVVISDLIDAYYARYFYKAGRVNDLPSR